MLEGIISYIEEFWYGKIVDSCLKKEFKSLWYFIAVCSVEVIKRTFLPVFTISFNKNNLKKVVKPVTTNDFEFFILVLNSEIELIDIILGFDFRNQFPFLLV